MFDNARTPHEERAEAEQPLPLLRANLAVALDVKPVTTATMHVTDWPQAQKEDPVLYRVVKNLRAPEATFKAALRPVLDRKAVSVLPQGQGRGAPRDARSDALL